MKAGCVRSGECSGRVTCGGHISARAITNMTRQRGLASLTQPTRLVPLATVGRSRSQLPAELHSEPSLFSSRGSSNTFTNYNPWV